MSKYKRYLRFKNDKIVSVRWGYTPVLDEVEDYAGDIGQIKISDGIYEDDTTVTDPELESITQNYTIDSNDGNTVLTFDNVLNTDIVITIPDDLSYDFPVKTEIAFIRNGEGEVSFTPATGVTLHSEADKNKIKNQYNSAVLVKVADNTWTLLGTLKA